MKHISVCVCTYKRPQLLARLLEGLVQQDTGDLFSYSIVIADNDSLQSAKPVTSAFDASSRLQIVYCVEPRQNIASARNKAVENANGDFIAFIDDDEIPAPSWLQALYRACEQYGSDGAVGPVKRQFDQNPPGWLLKGNFYERPAYTTGLVIDWTKGRTNNVLLRRDALPANEQPFRPAFRTGEDQDLFRRMIENGKIFVWCSEAVAYEVVPPVRWKRTFMVKRALLQGAASVLHPTFGARQLAKSLVAIPAYTVALPVALLFGQHRFMSLVIKLADHVGRLLGFFDVNPIDDQYVTE